MMVWSIDIDVVMAMGKEVKKILGCRVAGEFKIVLLIKLLIGQISNFSRDIKTKMVEFVEFWFLFTREKAFE